MFAVTMDTEHFLNQFDAAWVRAMREGLRELLAREGERLRSEAAAQFATAGQHGGEPWPPRKQRPRRLRPDAQGTGQRTRPLLISTGALRASLVEERNPAHVERIDVDERGNPYLVFGTRVTYAPFLHFGTRHMPPRALLTDQMLQGTTLEFP